MPYIVFDDTFGIGGWVVGEAVWLSLFGLGLHYNFIRSRLADGACFDDSGAE